MTIDELKTRIELPQLAEHLGLKKAKGAAGSTLWHAPGRPDKQASLSIYKLKGEWRFKDHATGEGGSCVDFVMYVERCSLRDAVARLHQYLGIPLDAPREQPREKSRAEYIAERCMDKPDEAIGYLVDERKIPLAIVTRAIAKGTVGWNSWTSSKVAEGEFGYGGPAAAFIVRGRNPGHAVAVDLRYLNPALNGGTKTMSHGEKSGYPWCSDWARFDDAHTIYVCEGAIDALTVESAELPYTAAIAVRGTATVEAMNWRLLAGKQAVLCFSNDPPFPEGHKLAGICPGARAAWRAHELLTELDISALLVDQLEWPWKDLNELIQKERDPATLREKLQKLEPWLIPGRPPMKERKDAEGAPRRKARVFLPWQDDSRYWSYRVRPDFTSQVKEQEVDDAGGGKVTQLVWNDLAGFRIASLSRVTIASPTSTMGGGPDAQPTVMFSVSVQAPRHGAKLLRRVIEDDKLHNIDTWKKFGPVFTQGPFLRMVNILERTAHLGARNAINFVGVAWRDGKLVVNEGPSCYFVDPRQQCLYWRLTFPSGRISDAPRVIQAFQATMRENAGALILVWALGAHLKALLGFWPHMLLQAPKGSGKSTFIKSLERAVAMTMLSGESIQTPFRILTSLSHTSHPIGWEEISARKQEIIDYAVRMLQEAYQHTVTQRGADMKEFLVSAPVMLAGEDATVNSLIGKLVRAKFTDKDGKPKKGVEITEDLPRFPVRQWLDFITTLSRKQTRERFAVCKADQLQVCMAARTDAGADRMAGNYAALRLAWELLCEFAGMDVGTGGFLKHLQAEMNAHIGETKADREPWVWITEILLSEIAKRNFQMPHTWGKVHPTDPSLDKVYGEDCLLVRTSHVMDHLAHTSALREKWQAMPLKSDRAYKDQLKAAGIVVRDGVERTIGSDGHDAGRRVSHLVALSIERMRKFGLHAVGPADVVPEFVDKPDVGHGAEESQQPPGGPAA